MSEDSHDASASSSGGSLLKDRRFKLSRRRRIKCDEGHPCQACINAKSACTFEEPTKRHPQKSKRTTTLEDRMHQLETLIAAIPPAVFAAGAGGLTHSSASFPLINPANHFATSEMVAPSPSTTTITGYNLFSMEPSHGSSSYLYFDDEGFTRWQGETSGLPLLDTLVERHAHQHPRDETHSQTGSPAAQVPAPPPDWFPDRTLKRPDFNPQTMWRIITSQIPPELMDSLVKCYLSTSYYILPFLHVPTFLTDYGNPAKWGEPGFAAFIVAICCLASRHVEDPRVRKDPNDGITAGMHYFTLLDRLRTLPFADRPTLYTIQANLIAAVYAVGLGKLTKAASLLSEAVAISIDAGLHRTADCYDLFDAVEEEVRKRTFWCVYIWDKQLAAHLGRPCLMRYRDCDVGEPSMVDDEFITKEGIVGIGPESRMGAFVISLRIMLVLGKYPRDAFLTRAIRIQADILAAEEALLSEIHMSIPQWLILNVDTMAADDTIRITQAGRLHCAEQFVRMLIYRYRFSSFILDRFEGRLVEEDERERETMSGAYHSALEIVNSHMAIAKKGLMTYYGVHVIHQLTQAGRTLVAVLLNCNSPMLEHLIPAGLEAVRNCVGLLRRFSGRYVCGLRSGDLMEEFCRLTHIPLESSPRQEGEERERPAWIRPVRKKAPSMSATRTRSVSSNPRLYASGDIMNLFMGATNPGSELDINQLFSSDITGINPLIHPQENGFGSQSFGM
ncbi:fungal-specific transcription factor domain-containing protein [Flagelloscypha sp. PMI_526]|nr:fungal-specific transcription factor domain-containing protein [Flagelloscypha sp. PMI_526]